MYVIIPLNLMSLLQQLKILTSVISTTPTASEQSTTGTRAMIVEMNVNVA